MSESLRLPARPSLEQLQKQAKELLRQFREGEQAAVERFRAAPHPTLADAQFLIARDYGFETWAKLKHHVEALRPRGIAPFEQLASDLAAAYTSDNRRAARDVNATYGTSFACDFHELHEMHRRLPTWYASETRTADLALADAQKVVAHFYGFESWAAFARSVGGHSASRQAAEGDRLPHYRIDWEENRIRVQGPQSAADWETIFAVMKERQIDKLDAGALSDEAMKRLAELDHVTALNLEGSKILTDEGARHLARMPQLRELHLGGWTSPIGDRGLEPLRQLTGLRRFATCWTQGISDAGLANLASCDDLEGVNLLGTPAGDGAIRALAGKRRLRQFSTGRGVTDAGLTMLHQLPIFKTWHGGAVKIELMSADAEPNHLLIDGPFTDAGLASLAGLDGLFGLTFFWHCPGFTPVGMAGLKHLPNLGFLGCQDAHCDDEAMRHIAAIPRLRMLMGQGAVAGDEGFRQLSRSQTVEYIWGRECPNLTGTGFAALSAMPALRGLAMSCKNVDDASLSLLPGFPALREFMPMDVPDEGFRHVGRVEHLERLWCMYCRETGDRATEHLAGLSRLRTYYAGMTTITDRSLEILGRMQSLESLEFGQCTGITDAGVAHLAALPRLREIGLHGLPGVTQSAPGLFPAHVRVRYSG